MLTSGEMESYFTNLDFPEVRFPFSATFWGEVAIIWPAQMFYQPEGHPAKVSPFLVKHQAPVALHQIDVESNEHLKKPRQKKIKLEKTHYLIAWSQLTRATCFSTFISNW